MLDIQIDSADIQNQQSVQILLQQLFKNQDYVKYVYEFSKYLTKDLPETTDVCYVNDDVMGFLTYLPLTICYKEKIVQNLIHSLNRAQQFDKSKYFNGKTKYAFVILGTATNLPVQAKIGLFESLIQNQKWTQSKDYLKQDEIIYKPEHFNIDYLIFVDKNPSVKEGSNVCDKNAGSEVFYDVLRKDKRVQVYYSQKNLVDNEFEFNAFYIVKLNDFSQIIKNIDQ